MEYRDRTTDLLEPKGTPGTAPVLPLAESEGPAHLKLEVAALYDELSASMLRYGFALTRDKEMSQDAVQESFFRYFIYRGQGGTIENAKSWLFRVLRNYVIDTLKARSAESLLTDTFSPAAGSDSLDAGIRRAIEERLSPRERDCVRLRAEGLQYEEIAAALNIRPGTVGTLLSRAMLKLKRAVVATSGD